MDEAKRERVRDWLTKAYIDLDAARFMGMGQRHLREVAVYHCQQGAEKAVKAYLFFRDHRFDRTHDIEILVTVAIPLNGKFEKYLSAAKRLTPYSVVYRYPDGPSTPTKREYERALRLADALYQFVLSLIPREAHPKR